MKGLRRLCALLLAVVLMAACAGCQSDTSLASVLAKTEVTGLRLAYMDRVGDDIPEVALPADGADYPVILDALYTAEAVTLDVSQAKSYSPELNAACIVYLDTAKGSMPVYVDTYQNIFLVPYMRADGKNTVRTYLAYYPGSTDLADRIAALEPAETQPETPTTPTEGETAAYPDLNGMMAADDTALRAEVTGEMLTAMGENVTFEAATNGSVPGTSVYAAFLPGELPEVVDGRLYITACADAAAQQWPKIASITNTDAALIVRVSFSGENTGDNAALLDASFAANGKFVLFLRDDDATLLYAQKLSVQSA